MELQHAEEWSVLPRLSLQSPVLAMLASRDGLWAGGAGAIAHCSSEAEDWTLCPWTPTLRMVLCLAEGGSTLFAAGVGGVLRSADRGLTWTHGRGAEQHTVLSLAISPTYGDDETILAGTAGSGVLRSVDGGLSWSEARFGMQAAEVSSLLWLKDHSILANTPAGVYQSTNDGRSWRLLEQRSFLLLCRSEEGLLAVDGRGNLLESGNGAEWSTSGLLPVDMEPQALAVAPTGDILVGTVAHGLQLSSDGKTWRTCVEGCILSLCVHDQVVYAGTETGVMVLTATSHTCHDWGSPYLVDYNQLLAQPDGILVSGVLTLPQRWSESEGWRPLDSCPLPLNVFALGWDGELVAVSGDGFYVSIDGGETWQLRSSVPGGDLLTIRGDGAGWLATADGSTLLVTRDCGHTWVPLQSPFGVFQVVAMQAAPQSGSPLLVAVTFDARQQSTTLWHSSDDGSTWQRGREAQTTWPHVSTFADPFMVSAGDAIMLRGPDGAWMRTQPNPGSRVRQVAASEVGLVARTQDGVWLLRTNDVEWRMVPDLPVQVASLCLDGGTLFVLGNGGDVAVRKVVP